MFSFFKNKDPHARLHDILGDYELPKFRKTIFEALRRLREPGASSAHIAEVMALDPDLTSRVMRTVNSTAYAPRTPIKSLDHAVTMLGKSELERIVMMLGAKMAVPDNVPNYLDMTAFWRRAGRRAVIARELADITAPPLAGLCFSAGFLEDFSVPAAANGVTATKPRAGSSAGDFNERCAANADCAGGIYTAETYDAVMMIGAAYNMGGGDDMATHLGMVGVGYGGASGSHTFLDNGDVAGAGYDICGFDALSSTDIYFTCMEWWSAIDGIQATPFAGMTVSIGFLNPMTGPIAVYAPGFGVAANVALGMMNIAGWNSGLQFEMVMVDSGCSGDVAAAGAQTLLDAGVVGVVGAACSGATMAANAVLGAAGIPMISYASTNPGLSDATAYPHFFRVVPSDAIQGPALADVVTADGGSDVALLYMTNDYGSGLADSFAAAWEGAGNTLCASIGYEDTTTDFTSQVQSVIDNSCGSVMLISYAADGAAIVEELAAQSFSGQIFGGDGIAEEGLCASMADPSLCDGIVATKPAAPSPNERSMAFAAICGSIPDCADGIYTAEAFDAMIIMGYSVFAQLSSPGATLSQMIGAVGQGFVGASGIHSFAANGDVGGSGYCVGTFNMVDGAPSFDCSRSWTLSGGVS